MRSPADAAFTAEAMDEKLRNPFVDVFGTSIIASPCILLPE
jgi:hypothetical protein